MSAPTHRTSMATEITCASTESVGIAHDSNHYTSVGLGGSVGEPAAVESVDEVLAGLADGEEYYVATADVRVPVTPAECSCGADTLAVEATPETGNPLRSLPSC